MKNEPQFALDRSAATIAAATAIEADWEWPEKTVAVMTTDRQALVVQAGISDTKDTALTGAIAQKNTACADYHKNTGVLLAMSRTHYRKNPAALATLKPLKANGDSEQGILDEGAAFAKAWNQIDPAYVPDEGWTLTAFNAAGTDCTARLGAIKTAEVAWSNASAQTDVVAASVEDTNVAWYADATRKFGPETPHGQMIRQTVPTTAATVKPPDAPVVKEAQALGGGKVHIDFEKPKSGWIQIWQQGPGQTAFVVKVDKLVGNFYEAGGFAPGANSFKFVGFNTGGKGGESAPIVIQVT